VARLGVFRVLTSPFRVFPDFIIIGTEKSGTTSLYDYMIQHPSIFAARTKEVHYFDINYVGEWWYKSHFPTVFKKNYFKRKNEKFVTGEATPYYLFHPLVPQRICQTLPKVKLIVILRNPIDRAYSLYHDNIRKKIENLSFEAAIKKEDERLKDEKEKILANSRYNSIIYWGYSYLTGGIYTQQLKTWFNFFHKNQFLILKTDDLQTNPNQVLNKTFSFLNVDNHEIQNLNTMNVGKYKPMETSTREFLHDYFYNYNKELENFLNMKFNWN